MIHNLSHINLKATPSLQTKLGLEVEVSKLSIDTIHDQRKSRVHKNAYTVNYHGRTEMSKKMVTEEQNSPREFLQKILELSMDEGSKQPPRILS